MSINGAASNAGVVLIVDLGGDVKVQVDTFRGSLPLLVLTAGPLEFHVGFPGHRVTAEQLKALDAVAAGVLRLRDELHRAIR